MLQRETRRERDIQFDDVSYKFTSSILSEFQFLFVIKSSPTSLPMSTHQIILHFAGDSSCFEVEIMRDGKIFFPTSPRIARENP